MYTHEHVTGFRLGDMEAAAIGAHGSASVFEERLFRASDGQHSVTSMRPTEGDAGQIYICEYCGMRADTTRRPGGWCNVCESSAGVRSCSSVAVWDTLTAEMATLGIGVVHEIRQINSLEGTRK